MRRVWQAKNCYKAEREWVRREGNEEWMLHSNLAELNSFTDWNDKIGGAGGWLESISKWYGALGGVELYKGDIESGLLNLSTAALCDYVSLVMRANFYSFRRDKMGQLSSQNFNLKLGRLISLGFFEKSSIMAEKMSASYPRSMYYEEYLQNCSFVLRLYLRSLGLSEKIGGLPRIEFPPYLTIMDHFLDEDPSETLCVALVEACDFHVAQSRDYTNSATYEFSEPTFQLYPAEILAILRLRENRGLPPAHIEHTLMDTPNAKLYPIQLPAAYPDFLADFVTRLKTAAPRYADGL